MMQGVDGGLCEERGVGFGVRRVDGRVWLRTRRLFTEVQS